MFGQAMARMENEFYRGLNRMVEPFVRAGVGSPVLWPTGAIVLETTGRKSGRTRSVPLLATRVGDLLLVSTVRRRSQWLKNLAANPEAHYWLAGRAHEATAFVIAREQNAPLDEMPPPVRCLASLLQAQSNLFGIGFAILIPRSLAGGMM